VEEGRRERLDWLFLRLDDHFLTVLDPLDFETEDDVE